MNQIKSKQLISNNIIHGEDVPQRPSNSPKQKRGGKKLSSRLLKHYKGVHEQKT